MERDLIYEGKTKTMTVEYDIERPTSVNGQNLEDVETFVYIGSKIAANGEADVDVQARLNKALEVFNRQDRYGDQIPSDKKLNKTVFVNSDPCGNFCLRDLETN